MYILTWKCASCHNFQKRSDPLSFVHFDLEMCFAPQRRALFRHLNFQKRSDPLSFVHFDLEMCFEPQRHTFSTSQLPNVVRCWCVMCILTWKCASRHNGVQFFISHLASWLRTCRFSEVTFRPSGAPNHWKNTVDRDFPTFSHLHLLASHSFSSLIFSLLDFSSLTIPTSAFRSLHIVESLTSILPSTFGEAAKAIPPKSSVHLFNTFFVHISIHRISKLQMAISPGISW